MSTLILAATVLACLGSAFLFFMIIDWLAGILFAWTEGRK